MPNAPNAAIKPATLDLARQPRKLPTRKRQPGEATMSAYFVVELEITNPEAMEPYRARKRPPYCSMVAPTAAR